MAKSADKAYGGESRGGSTILFDPEKLRVITDEKHMLYDERVKLPLNEERVASIMAHGVRVPIRVWKDPESGEVIVLDGKQRRRDALEANKRLKKDNQPPRMIQGTAFKGTMKAALAEMILLNEGREEPTSTGRARSVERLLEAGYSEQEVQTILHLKPGTLRNYQALASCTAVVRKAVDEGFPVTMAYKMSKLEPVEQREQLAVMLKAADGVKGKKKRAKKMRAASGEKRLRSKKEIQTMLAKVVEEFGDAARGTIDLLEWVLGGEEPSLKVPEKLKAVEKVPPVFEPTKAVAVA